MNFFISTSIRSVLLLFCLGTTTLLSSDNEPFTLKGVELEKISKIQEFTLLDPSTKKKIPVEVYFAQSKLRETNESISEKIRCVRELDEMQEESRELYSRIAEDVRRERNKASTAYKVYSWLKDYKNQFGKILGVEPASDSIREDMQPVDIRSEYIFLRAMRRELNLEFQEKTKNAGLEDPSFQKTGYLVVLQKETRELLSFTDFRLCDYPSGAKIVDSVDSWMSKRFIGREMVQLVGKYLEKIAKYEKCSYIFFFTSNRNFCRYLDPLGYKAYPAGYDVRTHEPFYTQIKKVKI